MPGTSKSLVRQSLPLPGWLAEGLPQPRTLILIYRDARFGEQALKLYQITSDELPPLVGQGPREIEEVFIEAYQRNAAAKSWEIQWTFRIGLPAVTRPKKVVTS